MNLFLTGFMGTGKSTVGPLVAERLGFDFLDMDAELERRTRQTVAQIFAGRGEGRFRALELELLGEISARSRLVVAAGGGSLLSDGARRLVRRHTVVTLQAPLEELLRRLDGAERPLAGRARALYEERRPVYARLGWSVDTRGLSPDHVAERVVELWRGSDPDDLWVQQQGRSYAVAVAHGVRLRLGNWLAGQGRRRWLVAADRRLAGRAAELGGERWVLPAGERAKRLGMLAGLYAELARLKWERGEALVSLGGGAVMDAVGTAAATYLRGLPLYHLPTTLLGMADASVGGKAAVNLPAGKNLVGAFYPPSGVLADLDYLETLPLREWRNGLAEVIKAAVIGSPALFQLLEELPPLRRPLPGAWREALPRLIRLALEVKVAVVEADPLEEDRRRVLNLGHTFAHGLEALSRYRLPHGQAVAIGLCVAARLGPADVAGRLEALLSRHRLPTRLSGTPVESLLEAMSRDKKRRDGQWVLLVPRAIGEVEIAEGVPEAELRKAILASGGSA